MFLNKTILSAGVLACLIGLAACSSDDGDLDVAVDTPAPGDTAPPAVPMRLTAAQAGRFQVTPFAFDEGAAEIVAYDGRLNRLFVVNSSARTVDVLDIADSDNIMRIGRIDATAEGASANSVAVFGTTVAVAIEADTKTDNGKVVFYNSSDFSKLGEATVGALPDMVTFTPDGQHVLVANEGEPNDDYDTDPEGSVSVIDVSGGFQMPATTTVGFASFNGQADALRASGVRIFGPNATVAQDLEPEYIAVSADSSRAYVSLQENNAIAVIDLDDMSVIDINPLGYKDHSIDGQGIDPSNEDGLNIRPVPVFGMYQPDTISAFEQGGVTYLLTANEGDSRDYEGFSEESDVKDLDLDADAFPDADALQDDSQLGDLKVTTTLGDTDGDGAYEALYVFGARSFSIRRADDAVLVYDSGDALERITGDRYGDGFNADNTDNEGDDRSDNKGPEPEAIAHGRVGDGEYAFVGLERMSGFAVYDISDVASPEFVTYVNNRDLTEEPASGNAGDLGPESIVFIAGDDDSALLAVGNEVSGSTTLYRLALEPLEDD